MPSLIDKPELLAVPDLPETANDKPSQSPPPTANLLGDLVHPKLDGDPDELLRNRFLCRGGGLLLCGPTGIGKSSLSMQAAILWALGRECFGIVPARRLKSLFVEAENDLGDLCEMRDGEVAGLELSDIETREACGMIRVAREDSRTGFEFLASVIRPLLEIHRPDLLWLDPVLAYLGGEASAQRDVTTFLRNHLNPLLHEFNCAAVVVHHTNKPPSGREKSNWAGNDFAYLGSGSIEWANWARAILVLRGIGSHSVFELRAPKRGSRLGWKDVNGETAYAKLIGHAKDTGVICWREASTDEIESGGRPKSYDPAEILALLPPDGLTTGEWLKLAKAELGISHATFHRERCVFEKQGCIWKSKIDRKWQGRKP